MLLILMMTDFFFVYLTNFKNSRFCFVPPQFICERLRGFQKISDETRLLCLPKDHQIKCNFFFETISLANHYHDITGKAFILTDCYRKFSSKCLPVSMIKIACVLLQKRTDKIITALFWEILWLLRILVLTVC